MSGLRVSKFTPGSILQQDLPYFFPFLPRSLAFNPSLFFPSRSSQSSEAARVVEAKKRALQAQLAETRAIAQSYAKQESNLLDA
jgi:hypothetical protein